MRALVASIVGLGIAVGLAAGCKGKPKPGAGSGSATTMRPDAAPIVVDWAACDKALRAAAAAPLDARPKLVIDGCRVCDWRTILSWAKPAAEGGPKRTDLDAAMAACGYCDANSKMRFLGVLDKTGGDSRAPWRELGNVCKERLSATPDSRFMSAPFYALDRIARAASARGGETATLLAALELPVPAVTISGVGVVLPDLDRGVAPKVGSLHVTVLGDAIHAGRMPRAKLGANGVTVDLGPDGYPGPRLTLAELGPALTKHAGGDATHTIAILAPHATPAEKLLPVIAAAANVAPVYLGVHAHEAPESWQLPGAVPIALTADPKGALVVTGEMTVQNLAAELAKRALARQDKIGVVAKGTK